ENCGDRSGSLIKVGGGTNAMLSHMPHTPYTLTADTLIPRSYGNIILVDDIPKPKLVEISTGNFDRKTLSFEANKYPTTGSTTPELCNNSPTGQPESIVSQTVKAYESQQTENLSDPNSHWQYNHQKIHHIVNKKKTSKPPQIDPHHSPHPLSSHPYYRNCVVIRGGFDELLTVENSPTSPLLSTDLQVYPKPPPTSVLGLSTRHITKSEDISEVQILTSEACDFTKDISASEPFFSDSEFGVHQR
ncbi:hypothetical protein HK096_002254, partial [Nowakowskiella sp. JEL0078]